MASSLKLSELPVSSSLNDDDLFLVSDVSESASKQVTLSVLNSQLRLDSLEDYAQYTADLAVINTKILEVEGDNRLKSITEIETDVSANTALITQVDVSLGAQITQVSDDLNAEISSRGNINAQISQDIDNLEAHNLQAGLATGFLYISTFQGG